MPAAVVLRYVVFQAPLLCGGILGMLRLPKIPQQFLDARGNPSDTVQCSFQAQAIPLTYACVHITNLASYSRPSLSLLSGMHRRQC